eukprot:5505243-Pyramimonas_sp.AAC.1
MLLVNSRKLRVCDSRRRVKRKMITRAAAAAARYLVYIDIPLAHLTIRAQKMARFTDAHSVGHDGTEHQRQRE